MKNKVLLIILTIVLSIFPIRETYSFPCDSVNPPYCECNAWTTNEQWGSSIVIPTGNPTCYYTVTYNIRQCQCGSGYTKYQFKILGITKYGDCTGKTDGEIFTEIYSFILLIAKDLFEIPIDAFELDIIAPACYQWVGDELQACQGNACCHKTWLVRFNEQTKTTEIASTATLNEVCGVTYTCPNICDSLNLSDGTLNYPAWPSNCLAQDPCPNVPWDFNPTWNKVYGMVGTCPFVAFYETKNCPTGTIFRVKFIQLACSNNLPSPQVGLAKAVRRILNELPGSGPLDRYLLSYSCWTLITGYDSRRIAPCLDVDECCYIYYRTNGPPGSRSLGDQNLISSGNPDCSDNCTYVCSTLVTLPFGQLPDRWAPRIAVPEETKPIERGNFSRSVTANVVQNNLVIRFDFLASENLQISIFNILGEKVYDGTISSSNRSEFKMDITSYARGFYSFVLRLNNQTFFGTFLKY